MSHKKFPCADVIVVLLSILAVAIGPKILINAVWQPYFLSIAIIAAAIYLLVFHLLRFVLGKLAAGIAISIGLILYLAFLVFGFWSIGLRFLMNSIAPLFTFTVVTTILAVLMLFFVRAGLSKKIALKRVSLFFLLPVLVNFFLILFLDPFSSEANAILLNLAVVVFASRLFLSEV